MKADYTINPEMAFLSATIADLKNREEVFIFNKKQYDFIKDKMQEDPKLKIMVFEEEHPEGCYASFKFKHYI